MRILVLDTIHGGAVLAEALLRHGDDVDAIDVYRGGTLTPEEAATREYDLITAPVHLDPDYPLLHTGTPVISHHEMTRRLIGTCSIPLIEITGARGKTTTAFALASLMPGPGILHTSRGTFRFPEKKLLFKKSITPASLLFALRAAETEHAGWIIAEESAGVSGAGVLGILTSERDYPIGAGKKSALEAKRESLAGCSEVLDPERVEALTAVEDMMITSSAGSFENPLVALSGYRQALRTAAAAAVLLGCDASPLSSFSAIEGRMCLADVDGVPVLDNSNSGTTAENTREAAAYLRRVSGRPLVLVIGEERHAVCEGFSDAGQDAVIADIAPDAVIRLTRENALSFDSARAAAIRQAQKTGAAVLLAVKTWR